MLVLMDRGFDAGEFLAAVAATRAQFLVRLNATRRPPVLARLPDGSVLSLIGGVKVRIIAATVTVTCHDGTSYGGSYRLATTLLDHRAYPAEALICPVPRAMGARDRLPRAAAHPARRPGAALGRPGRPGAGDVGAAGPVPGAADRDHRRRRHRPGHRPRPGQLPDRRPDRPGYWSPAPATSPTGATDLAGGIGRAVLANLHGPRRPRVCARKVKSPLSRWNKHPPGKPRTCQQITSITTPAITADHERGHADDNP